MENQILEKLFDSPIKVRLLKLFLRNDGIFFSIDDIASKIHISARYARKEVEKLNDINFLKTKTVKIKVRCGLKKIKVKKAIAYSVNSDFTFYPELKNLVFKSSPASEDNLRIGIQKIGKIKLVILAGLFINSESSRIDLVMVGDGINQKKLERFLGNLEAEVGKDIKYVVLTTEEFNYRLSMFDRFLRDVLDYPHKKLINKLKIWNGGV
ncbi:MAG: hypothetical protein US76_00095 [Parcubacteria group bacterium GW2011_GWA2_38_13b]|nr:MAG: hypothetical protein US76_00095 [Parcubacteria group bacterium GW2011_GWA2_38_13b]